MIKYAAALFFPGIIVMLFSSVTYNRVLALMLTVALIAASVYKGYTDTFLLIVIDSFSLTVGFWMSQWLKERSVKRIG
ncbi:DUF2198 family protein [Niallia sp. 03133]|uniref:DUF2198 family protein n=1 Tax=Niallia sp. 03133 TaxID=3458060 RepID=UPI0040449ADB